MECVYCGKELEDDTPKIILHGIQAMPAEGCCFEDDVVIPYHRECFFKLPPALREPWMKKWDGS
jgi:hypothetical protein